MRRSMTYDPRGVVLWGLIGNQWRVASLNNKVAIPYDGEAVVYDLRLSTDEYAGAVWHKYLAIAIHQAGENRADRYRVGDIVALFKGINVRDVYEEDIDAALLAKEENGYIPLTVQLYHQHISFLEGSYSG